MLNLSPQMNHSVNTASELDTRIRSVLARHSRLSVDALASASDADLYEAGMTSHATVDVMLALEGEFDVEFPDEMLKRSVFVSIDSIRDALNRIVPT
jgi:acyl carrier protein